MDLSTPIIFGIDLAGFIAAPVMIAMFVFAVWFGVTRAGDGIDEDEATRRNDAVEARGRGGAVAGVRRR